MQLRWVSLREAIWPPPPLPHPTISERGTLGHSKTPKNKSNKATSKADTLCPRLTYFFVMRPGGGGGGGDKIEKEGKTMIFFKELFRKLLGN